MEVDRNEFLSLSAYIVQSSLAMNDALMLLASHPANADVSSALSSCLDSAKLLLTKVVSCLINHKRSSPMFYGSNTSELILAKTTFDKMQVRFRNVDVDILGRVMDYAYEDTAKCRLVCRSWYLAAKGKGCLSIDFAEDMEENVKRIAGLGLQKIVGYDWFPVVRIEIDLGDIDDLHFIRMIARLVGPSLSNLILHRTDYGREKEPEFFYEVLSIFFENCPRIKALALYSFDFGPEPFFFLSDVIRSGMSRLLYLKINSHDGELGVIVENISIQLISFEYCRYDIHDLESSVNLLNQIDQVSRCYQTLESLFLECEGEMVIEPSRVLEIVKKFKSLKRLEMNGNLRWSVFDMQVISKLPLLESLKIEGFWTADSIRPLINCKSLKKLNLYDTVSTKERPIYLFSLLRGIGRQLRDLTIRSRISHELISQLPDLCPNLESIWVRLPTGAVPGQNLLERRFRSEMKRLGAISLPES
jgi:hypothetical protein